MGQTDQAAATLAQSDLPPNTKYSLTFYRALALVWVTSARRPNEIARLRLDCLREDLGPEMLNEDGVPVEKVIDGKEYRESSQEDGENKLPKIYYLQIPAGKSRGSFWIWLPDYVAEAINAWKRERPSQQRNSLLKKSLAELYGKKNIGNRTFSSQLLASTFCRDFVSYFIVFFFPSC